MSRRKQAKPRPVREDEEETNNTPDLLSNTVTNLELTETAIDENDKKDVPAPIHNGGDSLSKDTNNNKDNRESIDDPERLVIVEPSTPEGDADIPSSSSSSVSNDKSASVAATPGKGRKGQNKIVPVALDSGEKKYICPICNEELGSQHHLTVHIRNHNSKVPSSHSCTICGKVLCSQSSLDRHMLVHSGERPFKCQICHVSFTTNGNMHRHMRVHEKEFAKSPYLLKTALDNGLLTVSSEHRRGRKRKQPLFGDVGLSAGDKKRRNVELDDSAPLAVPLNNETDSKQESMKLPVSSPKQDSDGMEEVKIMCHSCGSRFDKHIQLNIHLENNPECHFRCGECGNQFIDQQQLGLHNIIAHQKENTPTKIDDRRETVTSSINFPELGFDFSGDKLPLVNADNRYDCKKCQMAFSCQEDMTNHMISHIPDDVIHCQFCDCDFVDNATLKEHLSTHTAELVVSDDQSKSKDSNVTKGDFLAMLNLSSGSGKPLTCKSEPLSEKPFNQNYFRKLGQIEHSGMSSINSSAIPSPVAAILPDESNSQDFADIHKIIMNANTTSIPTFSAGSIVSRMSPASSVHSLNSTSSGLVPSRFMSSSFPYKQDTMDLEESDRSLAASPADSNLTDVTLDTAAENEATGQHRFTCKYCEIGFETFNAMKVHMRSHLGLSPFKCNMCPYASADKTTLIRHLRTHNGERPFQCKVCSFAFTTKANCERHVKKKHGRETKEDIDEVVGYNEFLKGELPNVESTVLAPKASGDAICKYCGEDFKFFRALKHHLRSHASCRQKPYVCTLCDIGFSTKANCIRHIQKQHGQINVGSVDQFIKTNIPQAHSPPNHQEIGSLASAYPTAVMALQSGLQSSIQFPSPPPAHSSKPQVPYFPIQIFPPTYVASCPSQPPPVPSITKVETPPPNTRGGNPIDFSIKSEPEDFTAKKRSPDAPVGAAEQRRDAPVSLTDEPIDLTKSSMSITETPTSNGKHSLKHGKLQQMLFSSPVLGAQTTTVPVTVNNVHPAFRTFRCPVCQVQFSSDVKLHSHMKTHTTNRPFQCTFCPAGFTIKTNLDIHVRTRHLDSHPAAPSTLASLHSMLGSRKYISPTLRMLAKRKQTMPQHIRQKAAKISHSSNVPPQKANETIPLKVEAMTNDDLASVNKILSNSKSDMFSEFPILPVKEENKNEDELFMMEPSAEQLRSIMEDSYSKEEDKCSDGTSTPKKKKNSYANAPNRVACPYCGRNFPWISSLRRHILTHTGQKPFKCPECSVWFSTKSNRERHLLRKHGLNPSNPNARQIMDRPYKCQLCVFSSFSKPEKLLMHYKSKHPESDLPMNLQNMASLEKWEHKSDDESGNEKDDKDAESDDGVVICEKELTPQKGDPEAADFPECAVDEAQEDNFGHTSDGEQNEHEPTNEILNHAINMNAVVNSSQIGVNLGLENESIAVSSPHPSPARYTINPERDNYNVDKILDCWMCNENFTTRKLLLRHLKEHNVDYPYKCYLCDASFLTRKECLEHKTVKHIQDWDMLRERNKIEQLCEFVDVMDKLAAEQKPEETESLKKEPSTDGQEDAPMTPVERKVFCSLCTKRFWSLQDLRRHMRSHTGEKPFECDICGRYFTLKHSMMRHRRKHNIADDEAPPIRNKRQRNMLIDSTFHKDIQANNTSVRNSPERDMIMMVPKESYPVLTRAMIQPIIRDVPKVKTTSASIGVADDGSDMLHNLLGVEMSSIDEMLDSADNAAQMLGMGAK